MPVLDFVEVRICVDGKPLHEYDDPESDSPDDQHVRYVQATTGQAFEVCVTWLPGFQFKDAPFLHCKLIVGGQTACWSHTIAQYELQYWKGKLTHAMPCTFKSTVAKDEDGQWRKYTHSFGALPLIESTEINSDITAAAIKQLGTISVRVYRAMEVQRNTPWIFDGYLSDSHHRIPEKMLKGQQIKNIITFVPTGEAGSPAKPEKYSYEPVNGIAGRVTEYIFKYRSKTILQSLGCIPRSPSPEPDLLVVTSRQEELIKQQKDNARRQNLENFRLREQLQLLQNRLTEAAAALGSDRTDSITNHHVLTSNGNTASIDGPILSAQIEVSKRARDVDNDDLQIVTPPPKKALVMIDLTVDD